MHSLGGRLDCIVQSPYGYVPENSKKMEKEKRRFCCLNVLQTKRFGHQIIKTHRQRAWAM